MTGPATPVGVAVVLCNDRCLVGTRSDNIPLAGRCEFPGGKCLAGESPRDAAVRECREETGLEIEPVALLGQATHVYDHGSVDVQFWYCRPRADAAEQTSHRGFHWVAVDRLDAQRFPAANAEVIEALRSNSPAESGDQTESTHEA